jgi:hypothetical protein
VVGAVAGALALLAVIVGVGVGLAEGFTAPLALGALLVGVLLGTVAVRSLRASGHAGIADDGMVDIVDADGHHRFSAANPGTAIEVVGEPGDREWRVLFHRRTLPPVAVDATMVDPEEFLRGLRAWRPEL